MRPPRCGSPLGSLRNTAKGHRPLGNHLGCVIRHVRYAAVRLRTRKPVPRSSAQTSKSPALNLTLAASHTRCRMHRCTSSSWQHRYQAGVVAEGDQEFHTFGLEFLKERNRGGRKSGKTKFPSFPIRLVSSDVTSVPETNLRTTGILHSAKSCSSCGSVYHRRPASPPASIRISIRSCTCAGSADRLSFCCGNSATSGGSSPSHRATAPPTTPRRGPRSRGSWGVCFSSSSGGRLSKLSCSAVPWT